MERYVFYDPRDFKILECKRPDTIQSPKSPLDVNVCKISVERNFMDADMMTSVACFLQWLIHTSQLPNQESKIQPFLQVGWIQSALKYIKKGMSGSVSVSDTALQKRLSVAIKNALTLQSITDFIHEYVVSMYGCNMLRSILPNFCFTYALYHHDYRVRLVMEKIDGIQYIEFMKKMVHEPFSTKKSNDFLRIWIQILCALEVAQETIFFTHYDLHGENILLRRVDNTIPFLDYPVYDTVYRLENVDRIATMIDFGHSTVRYDKGFIGKMGSNSFPEYGMYPFYIPGADLFKIAIYSWLNIFHKRTFQPNTMGHVLSRFFLFLIQNFYSKQISNPKQPHYLNLEQLSTHFNDGTHLPCIFYSPYDALQWMAQRSQEIHKILGIQAYPWKTRHVSSGYTYYTTLHYKKQETYRCFENMFCSKIQPLPRHLYKYTTIHKEVILDVGDKELILKKVIPVISMDRIKEIEQFLEPKDVWSRFLTHVDFLVTQAREKSVKLPKDIVHMVHYYRAYVCLQGYRSYLAQFYKF